VNKISVLYSFVSINISFCGRMIVTRETPKCMEKILPHCYCNYHKSHKHWPGIALRRNCKLFLLCFRSVHVGTSSQNSPISKFVSVHLRQGCQTYGTRYSMASQSSDQRLYTVKKQVYTYKYLSVYRMYTDHLCYQLLRRVKHFDTDRERCEVLTRYLSLGHRPVGDLANT
jgi:hypothetical protein